MALDPYAPLDEFGITRIEAPDALWPHLERLGDRQSFHLLERYVRCGSSGGGGGPGSR